MHGVGWNPLMRARLHKTIALCIPAMSGRSTSRFHPARETSRAPRMKRRETFGESVEGHHFICTACKSAFGTVCVLSCAWREGRGTHVLLALVIVPLTMHPFRDGAPFLLLIETLPTFGRS